MSDLHCRLAGSATESNLEVGATRIPPQNHPVQALLDHIATTAARVDALVVAGDFANRACREGLNQGWDYSIEIARSLGTETVIPAIGNHDVVSRRSSRRAHQGSFDPYYDVKNLRPGFPFKDEAATRMYLSDGFCLDTIGEFTQVIAINTVIDHHDEKSAERGRFDDSRIHRLTEFLKTIQGSSIRIAVMHHHPILHTGPFTRDMDVLENGDKLVKALRENGCRLIIHGHRHLARLSVYDGVFVFASGSFSGHLGIYASAMANTFHFAEIEDDGGHTRGQIETWVWVYGSGWVRASSIHSGISFHTGFGATVHVDEVIGLITGFVKNQPLRVDRFTSTQLLAAAPDLAYLTPAEVSILQSRLMENRLQLVDTKDGLIELWRLTGS